MAKEKNLRCTKCNPHISKEPDGSQLLYEFDMYSMMFNYYVPPFKPNERDTISGVVEVRVFGLIIKVVKEMNGNIEIVEIDKGPLTAQTYECNYLLQQLCRETLKGIDHIDFIIQEETVLWNNNKWGNPYGRKAEQELKIKLRIKRGAPTPPMTNNIKSKQRQMVYKSSLLRNLKPYKGQ